MRRPPTRGAPAPSRRREVMSTLATESTRATSISVSVPGTVCDWTDAHAPAEPGSSGTARARARAPARNLLRMLRVKLPRAACLTVRAPLPGPRRMPAGVTQTVAIEAANKAVLCGCLTLSAGLLLLGGAVGLYASMEVYRLETLCVCDGSPGAVPWPTECSRCDHIDLLRVANGAGFALAGVAARGVVCILALGTLWLSVKKYASCRPSPRLPTHLLRGMHVSDGPDVEHTPTAPDTNTSDHQHPPFTTIMGSSGFFTLPLPRAPTNDDAASRRVTSFLRDGDFTI